MHQLVQVDLCVLNFSEIYRQYLLLESCCWRRLSVLMYVFMVRQYVTVNYRLLYLQAAVAARQYVQVQGSCYETTSLPKSTNHTIDTYWGSSVRSKALTLPASRCHWSTVHLQIVAAGRSRCDSVA